MTPLYVENRELMVGYLSGSTTPGRWDNLQIIHHLGKQGKSFETIPYGQHTTSWYVNTCTVCVLLTCLCASQTGQRILRFHLNWRAMATFVIRYAAFWSTLHKSSSITHRCIITSTLCYSITNCETIIPL